MKIRTVGLRIFHLGLLASIGACGGGGGGRPAAPVIIPPVPPPPVTESISALGPITALGSATVNGVIYETGSTTATVNGQLANFSDLKLGQIVSLEGDIEVNAPRGTADRIDYEATLIGPIESIDAALGQLIVMSQSVLTDADTVFDPSIDPATFVGLTVGANAQISGFLNVDGEVVATRVEPDAVSTGVQIIGGVSGLDLANSLFNLNGLTVDYGSATLIELPGGMPAEGLFVLIRGALISGVLVVDEIEALYDAAGSTPGERAQSQGVVTRFESATDFDVNGFPITTDAGTVFMNGTEAELQADVEITVDGEFGAGGDVLLANEITFGRVIGPTSTLTFNLSNFTEISVTNVFSVTVTRDPDFLVEVTIDEDDANRVDVTQTGSTLNIGLLPASGEADIRTIEAIVTMPVLSRIDLDGVINVTLDDFNQPQLTANVGGVSRLQSDSLTIGGLVANVSGVSQLELGDIRPVGTANIDVSGVSKATLNMDIGSSLTGTVTGPSSLFYYGTNVTVNVTKDPISNVVKLGETRP